jgi:hypothetical protein
VLLVDVTLVPEVGNWYVLDGRTLSWLLSQWFDAYGWNWTQFQWLSRSNFIHSHKWHSYPFHQSCLNKRLWMSLNMQFQDIMFLSFRWHSNDQRMSITSPTRGLSIGCIPSLLRNRITSDWSSIRATGTVSSRLENELSSGTILLCLFFLKSFAWTVSLSWLWESRELRFSLW